MGDIDVEIHWYRFFYYKHLQPYKLGAGEEPAIVALKNKGVDMLDKKGKVIEVNEENVAEIARKEMELEKSGKDPEKELFEPEIVNMSDEEIQEEENTRLLEAEENTLSDEDKVKRTELIKAKEESKEKTDEELISADPKDLSEDEKTKRTTIIEAEETESKRLIDAKEEDLNDEDKEKRKTVVLKAETKKKEELDVKVETYAGEKKISNDDARKVLESAGKIIEKYSGDSEKIAIANLGLQQLVSKKDEEILAVKQEANQPKRPQSAREWEVGIKDKGLTRTDGKWVGWETDVEDYRAKNEAETEGMDDEQVLKIVAKEIHLRSDAHFKEQSLKAKTDADEKRIKLVDAIPEKDKQYTDDVRGLLKTVPDRIILSENYSVEHSLRWARGGYFTPDKITELEKAAELKGFERGQASKKIISGPIGDGSPPKSKGTITWTEKEKEAAFDMFPNVEDEKERFKLWKEVKDSREKNKKKKEK